MAVYHLRPLPRILSADFVSCVRNNRTLGSRIIFGQRLKEPPAFDGLVLAANPASSLSLPLRMFIIRDSIPMILALFSIKINKFHTFYLKNLHISKKSSTFAVAKVQFLCDELSADSSVATPQRTYIILTNQSVHT